VHTFLALSVLGALNQPLGVVKGQIAYRPAADSRTPGIVARHRRYSISNLKIELRGTGRFRASGKTNAEGQFHFDQIPVGEYRLLFKSSSGETYSTQVILSPLKHTRAYSLDLYQDRKRADRASLQTTEIRLPSLRDELLAIFQEDQRIRQKWIAGDVSKDQPETLKLMEQINLRHVLRLQSLVSKYGWLSPELVGHDGSKGAFLVIQHSPPATQVHWFPVLQKAFQRGQLPPDEFAMFTDRVLLAKGEKQRFGTVALPPKEWNSGEPVFQPIEDPAGVDTRRASVGLPPLAEYKELLRTMYMPADVKTKGANLAR